MRVKEKNNMYKNLPTFRVLSPRILPGFEGEGAAGGAGTAGLTEEQVVALIKKNVPDVNTIVNNAVSNLRKTDIPKLLDDRINPLSEKLTTIGTGLDTLLNKGGNGDGGSGGGNGGSGGGGGNGTGGNGTGTISPEFNAKLKGLETELTQTKQRIADAEKREKDAEARAEQSDRHGKIKMALSNLSFANDRAGDTAFTIVEPHVKRQEDGSVIGGDNLPLEVFFRDFITREHPYLLKGTGAAGAGASGGSSGSGGRAVTADLSMIKPGMTPQERALVMSAIVSASQSR